MPPLSSTPAVSPSGSIGPSVLRKKESFATHVSEVVAKVQSGRGLKEAAQYLIQRTRNRLYVERVLGQVKANLKAAGWSDQSADQAANLILTLWDRAQKGGRPVVAQQPATQTPHQMPAPTAVPGLSSVTPPSGIPGYTDNAPRAASPAILANQAFYLPNLPKRILVRWDRTLTDLSFKVVDCTSGKQLLSGTLRNRGAYPLWGGGNRYYEADVSGLTASGKYKLVIHPPRGNDVGQKFTVGDRPFYESIKKAVDFFTVQRCGVEVPGWHKKCHVDDPVTGGWHDAGDFGKYIYTQWQPVFALLNLMDQANKIPGLTSQRLYEEAKFGNDFLLGMVKEDGNMWSEIYKGMQLKPPESDTDGIKGTIDDRRKTQMMWGPHFWAVALSSATFAKMALQSRGAYREKNLEAAVKTNHFARRYLTDDKVKKGEDLQGVGGLLMSDLLLYRLTGQKEYKTHARSQAELLLSRQHPQYGYFSGQPMGEPIWQDYVPYFFVDALDAYQQDFPSDPVSSKIRSAIVALADKHIVPLTRENPYGQEQWDDRFGKLTDDKRPVQNFYPPFSWMNGISRGQNSYYLSSADVALIAHRYTNEPRFLQAATQQIDWILGINPKGISQMEGVGETFPKKYHHRYSLIPGNPRGAVPGAIVNGYGTTNAMEDYPFFDMLGGDWHTSEPWLPHNAWYLMVAEQLLKSHLVKP